MLNYEDHDLVEVIIHESTHATLYIKSNADFNERLATFVGSLGVKAFYTKLEGPNSATAKKIGLDAEDEKIFSEFITAQIKDLEQWYKDNSNPTEQSRQVRFLQITDAFTKSIEPKLKTSKHKYFSKMKLNNAKLLVFKTYQMDLMLFDQVYKKLDQDIHKFLNYCTSLEKSDDPEKDMRAFVDPSTL
jgi:predicted aminopeptidase